VSSTQSYQIQTRLRKFFNPLEIDVSKRTTEFVHDGHKKSFFVQTMAEGAELARSLIDHKKVLVLAMNGPGVGAGAAWFQGTSDLFYAAEGSWLHVTFSQLGLIPENGSAYNWANHMGTHRANEILMLGERVGAEELQRVGMVNKIFPVQGFHDAVQGHLRDVLKERSGKSMIEMKRLANAPLREKRIVALFDAWNALAERFVDGEPARRMGAKAKELEGECGAFLLPFLLFSLAALTELHVLIFVNRKAKGQAIEDIGHESMTLFASDFDCLTSY
jgi:peroxisomal 3,2-trans-enoyl-CoA isomerase